MDTCKMTGCDQPVKYKICGLCSRCYSSRQYWKKKRKTYGVGALSARKEKLKFWMIRMDAFMPAPPKKRARTKRKT